MTPSPHDDHISIHSLGLTARVGVPVLERATPQRLEADITLWPSQPLSGLGDDLAGTIDYAAAAACCRDMAAEGEYQLIETLAERLATALLAAFPLQAVQVRVKKFILPDTGAVSVSLTRRRDGLPAAPLSSTSSP